MKRTTTLIVVLLAGIFAASAQSRSFRALEEKFTGTEGTIEFCMSGFFARSALWLAGEHEFKRAIKKVKNVRLLTVPKSAFERHGVSLEGFKKVIANDSFEEVATLRDGAEHVSVYAQMSGGSAKPYRYLILTDNPEDVVAVEIKGHVDISFLKDRNNHLSL